MSRGKSFVRKLLCCHKRPEKTAEQVVARESSSPRSYDLDDAFVAMKKNKARVTGILYDMLPFDKRDKKARNMYAVSWFVLGAFLSWYFITQLVLMGNNINSPTLKVSFNQMSPDYIVSNFPVLSMCMSNASYAVNVSSINAGLAAAFIRPDEIVPGTRVSPNFTYFSSEFMNHTSCVAVDPPRFLPRHYFEGGFLQSSGVIYQVNVQIDSVNQEIYENDQRPFSLALQHQDSAKRGRIFLFPAQRSGVNVFQTSYVIYRPMSPLAIFDRISPDEAWTFQTTATVINFGPNQTDCMTIGAQSICSFFIMLQVASDIQQVIAETLNPSLLTIITGVGGLFSILRGLQNCLFPIRRADLPWLEPRKTFRQMVGNPFREKRTNETKRCFSCYFCYCCCWTKGEKMWRCNKCTFDNSLSVEYCQICHLSQLQSADRDRTGQGTTEFELLHLKEGKQ